MIKLKLVVPLLLIAGLIGVLAPQTVAAKVSKTGTFSLMANGVFLQNVKAFERNHTLYIPFRAVFEQLGITLDYDVETHVVSYSYLNEDYSIDIYEENVYTPDGGYHLLIPLLTFDNRLYIPQDYVQDLLRIEVEQIKNTVRVRTLDYAYDEVLHGLAESYYNHDLPSKTLFTHDANPYGTMDYYDDWSPSESEFEKVRETKIGQVYYYSSTVAIVKTSRLYENPVVSTYTETDLYFRLQLGKWKISRMDSVHRRIDLLDDVHDKAKDLLSNEPAKVEKVLSDLRTNYDAINGKDAQAALRAYSPDFIESWNKNTTFSWEEHIEQSAEYPTERRDLLEAKVLYIDDETSAVYVKVLYTELPQTFDGQYEIGDLEEPSTYEEVLYLDKTEEGRWTFNYSDELDNNYSKKTSCPLSHSIGSGDSLFNAAYAVIALWPVAAGAR